MCIKEIFGLHIVNKNILYYALGVVLVAIGVGIALENLFKVGLIIAVIFVVVGLIIANIFYNRILNKKFLDFK